MIPTSVFPTLNRLYPNYTIKAIPEVCDACFGWSANIYTNLPVLAQIRVLKEKKVSEVSLLLCENNTKSEISIEWSIEDFSFCRPIKQRRNIHAMFIL